MKRKEDAQCTFRPQICRVSQELSQRRVYSEEVDSEEAEEDEGEGEG